jgi:hypothetical protein
MICVLLQVVEASGANILLPQTNTLAALMGAVGASTVAATSLKVVVPLFVTVMR